MKQKRTDKITISEQISDEALMKKGEIDARDLLERTEVYLHSCIRRLVSKVRVSSICPEEVKMRTDEILDVVLKMECTVNAVEEELTKRLPEALTEAEKDYASMPKRKGADKRKYDEKVAETRNEVDLRIKEQDIA